jgi:hypothetical protein
MTGTLNRPAITLIDETNKEAALINIKIQLTHDLQAIITGKKTQVKSSNSGNRTKLLLIHWSCLLRESPLTCLTKALLPPMYHRA